jgi:hypothetical protein
MSQWAFDSPTGIPRRCTRVPFTRSKDDVQHVTIVSRHRWHSITSDVVAATSAILLSRSLGRVSVVHDNHVRLLQESS